MPPKSILPPNWDVPEEFRRRLGEKAGRQRAMLAEGHLLLVLHRPPQKNETERTGRALWRRVVSVAERLSSGTVPSCSARERATGSSCAVHREFTASVRELSSGLRTVGERKGRCSPRSERQLRPPPPGRRSGPAVGTFGRRVDRGTMRHVRLLTCHGLAWEDAAATRPVTAAYVCSTPTRGADPCEKEHST